MLDVTVKTLDSNTRDFSVEENITVKEFKEKIVGTVNIPATTQRLIFRGRVLKDEKKLSEYQCHGQVIHLVEKPPPTSTGGSSTRSSTTRSDGHNNFFLGAVHLPAEVTDPTEIQQTVQQVLSGMGDVGRNARVTSRSSADGSSVDVHINLGPIAIQTPLTPAQLRINQIRNMLRQGNTAISTLEANLRGNSSSATVSSSMNNNYPTTSASTTTGQTQSRSSTTSAHQADSTSSSSSQSGSGPAPPPNSAASTAASSTSQTEPQTANQQSTQTGSGQAAAPNPRATELAEVMREMFSLEQRLRPHMDRYQTLLMDQPVYESGSEELRRARGIQNVCCQVMHYISHIYHSLSDFNVCMLSRPPRVATVPGMPPPINRIPVSFLGSPIPMSRADMGGSTTTQPATGQPSSTSANPSEAAASPGTAPTTGAPPTTAPGGAQPQAAQPNAPRMETGAVRPQMGATRPHIHPMGPRAMPPFGTQGMRPQGVRFTMPADGSGRTFHIRGPQIEIRQMPSTGGGQQGVTPLTPQMMQNIAQVIMQQIQQVGRPTSASPAPSSNTENTSGQPQPSNGQPQPSNGQPQTSNGQPQTSNGQPQTSNGQPQTTTADQTSTSSTPGASDSPTAGGVPRTVRVQVTQHGPVGQPGGPSVRVRHPAMVRVQTAVRQGNTPPPTTTTSASSGPQATTTPVGGSNNTSSTSTASQSGPRPMPSMNPLVVGMWDPFLPCHSRHRNANSRPEGARALRRSAAPRQTPQQQQQQRQQPQPASGSSIPGMPNVAEMISGVMNALSSQMSSASGPPTGSPTGPSTSQSAANPDLLQMFSHLSNRNTSPDNPQTLEQLFSGFTSVGEQHGFLNEMAGALSRDLRVNDLSQVMAGNPAPVGRIRPTIVDFINTRILQGAAPTPTNIRTSARRIITESRGEFREMLGSGPTLHDIDALATYCYFFEELLVEILTISVGDNALTESEYGERLVDLLQQSMHAGIQMTMYTYGGEAQMRSFIFNRLRAWSSSLGIPGGEMLGMMSAGHLNRIVDNMRVTEAEIMRYIIKNGEQPPDTGAPLTVGAAGSTGSSTSSDTMETATEGSFEAMEVDDRSAAGSSSSTNGSGLPTGWEAVVSPSWVPVMTRDIQRQRRQAPQGPFSNAYLHGLPPKRMKLAQDRPGRPTEGTSSFIRETLRRAVENSGVQPRTSMDALLEEAEGNTAIHSACDEQMKSALKQRMRSDPDYDPHKFPNTDKYLQK